MTGVMRRFSAALAAAAMAVSIVPFADISAYAEYAATHPEGFVYADGSKFMCDGSPYYYGGTNCYYLTYKSKSEVKNVFDDASKMGLKVIRIWGNLDVGKKTGEIDSQSGHETFDGNNDGTGEKDGVYFQYWDDEAGKPVVNEGDNPLCLIHYKQLGLYVYTSTEDIMKNVLKGSFLEKLPFEVIKVTEGEIISIDKRGHFEKSSFVPNEFCYGWNYYGYRKPAYDDDELFDICGMFGVSQEDLMLLYDMGYTDEEIEGMLCDRSMLRECIEEARVLVGEYY